MADEATDAAAGEYVLGTLDPAERAAFEARLTGDAAARGAVSAWRGRLEPLLDGGREVAPPASAWNGIQARIAVGAAANDDRVSRWWRHGAIAAMLLAVLGGTLALRPQPSLAPAPPVAPRGTAYVAAVTAKGAEPALLVTIDATGGRAVIRAIGLAPPDKRSLELWYIGPGRGPRSLGLVAGDMRMELPVAMIGSEPGAGLFAVSVEPEGGAPAGTPTGEIMYSGKPMAISGT